MERIAGLLGVFLIPLGDPDYDLNTDAKEMAVAMRGGTKLLRLPKTGLEAKSVGDVVVLGKDATESGLRDAIASRSRWRAVHLACRDG